MRVLTGRVIGGKVELGGEVAEGTPVAVLAPDDEAVELTPAQKAELVEDLDEIHRGELEDDYALLRETGARTGR